MRRNNFAGRIMTTNDKGGVCPECGECTMACCYECKWCTGHAKDCKKKDAPVSEWR